MSSPRTRSIVRGVLALLALTGSACGDDLPDPDLEPTSSTGSASSSSSDDGLYDLARLEVLEPEPAAIHLLGEPIRLHAQVEDPSGVVLPVDDVAWLDAADDTVLLDRLEGQTELPAGIYELAAVANLPNGDRLRSAVGGVRVQARWAGAYEGEVVLLVETMLPGGGPLVLRCEGPLDFAVSLDGTDAAVDDGGCTIEVFGQVFDGTYGIEMVIYPAGLVRGTASFAFDTPVGAFDLPLEWAGAFYDDRFSAGLEGAVELPLVGDAEVSGSLQARLVDRYLDPEE